MFFLCYGSSNLGSWEDIYGMPVGLREHFVHRLEKQLEEEKRQRQTKTK